MRIGTGTPYTLSKTSHLSSRNASYSVLYVRAATLE
jgi:hypothetical protein